ncbi:MAG: hypothetical protein ACRDZO_18185 [Egibacteraceae bacterium]
MDPRPTLFRQFDPMRPLGAAEDDLYVDWQNTLDLADDVKQRLVNAITFDRSPFCRPPGRRQDDRAEPGQAALGGRRRRAQALRLDAVRRAVGRPRGRPIRGTLSVAGVQLGMDPLKVSRKFSASMEDALLAARDRLRLRGLRRAVAAYEAEHGVFTEAEMKTGRAAIEGPIPGARS